MTPMYDMSVKDIENWSGGNAGVELDPMIVDLKAQMKDYFYKWGYHFSHEVDCRYSEVVPLHSYCIALNRILIEAEARSEFFNFVLGTLCEYDCFTLVEILIGYNSFRETGIVEELIEPLALSNFSKVHFNFDENYFMIEYEPEDMIFFQMNGFQDKCLDFQTGLLTVELEQIYSFKIVKLPSDAE